MPAAMVQMHVDAGMVEDEIASCECSHTLGDALQELRSLTARWVPRSRQSSGRSRPVPTCEGYAQSSGRLALIIKNTESGGVSFGVGRGSVTPVLDTRQPGAGNVSAYQHLASRFMGSWLDSRGPIDSLFKKFKTAFPCPESPPDTGGGTARSMVRLQRQSGPGRADAGGSTLLWNRDGCHVIVSSSMRSIELFS
jgi:hypothetical protein